MATVGDYLVQRLREWGVEQIFGYPGDGINGVVLALGRSDDQPPFIQARHEEMCAFQAVGYAKFSGKVGVCLATSGPGAIHLLNGLYDAKLDHVPVVAIVGQTNRTAMGGNYQQEVDLLSLFKDVAGDYVQMVTTPQQLPNVIDRALRIAEARRTVTCVILPADVQELEYEPPEHAFKMLPSSVGYTAPVVIPADEQLGRAAEVLNAGSRVAILAGQGARRASGELIQVAELLGAGIAKALLGKDAVPDDLPFVTGSIGLLGSKASDDLMQGCDTLLVVGSNMPYAQFYPQFGQARGVQIDVDGSLIGMRYPMEVNLVGDSAATLRALLPLLERKTDRSWRSTIEESVRDWWKLVEARAMEDADPVNPQRLFWELSSRLPGDAMLAADSGSAANWYARDLKFTQGMRGSLSGTLASMGPAVPYAIGAKFAHPDRPAFALTGDGAMQMNGNGELLTIAKYWRRWADPRLVVLVLNNSDLNQVTWEMRAMGGEPKFEAAQVLPAFDYARYADLCGLTGVRVESPEAVGPAWDQALAADRPVVIDAVVDPEIPPLPPHVDREQALNFLRSVLKGDPHAARVIKHGLFGKVMEVLPKR